jgi:hypothetical protein
VVVSAFGGSLVEFSCFCYLLLVLHTSLCGCHRFPFDFFDIFPQVGFVKSQVGCFGLLTLFWCLAHRFKSSEHHFSVFSDQSFQVFCEVFCASSGKISELVSGHFGFFGLSE